MCWSPTADLVAGSVVGAIGIAALTQVRRPRQLPLACLPLLLGAHQLVEAAVWHGSDGMPAGAATRLAVLIWAAIAFPLLPAYLPPAVLCAVWPDVRARQRLLPLCVIGLASSTVLAYALASGPVTAEVKGHLLAYNVQIPFGPAVIAGYLLATLGAPLLGGNRDLRRFGLVAAAAALVCVLVWDLAFASTWCAFAAVVSLLLVFWLRRDRADPAGRTDSAEAADIPG